MADLFSLINRAANATASFWFWPLQGLPVWAQMLITAVPLTLFALLVFRHASDQSGITAVKDQIKACLLELWLYRDSPGVMLKAQGRIALNSFAYLGYSLVPLAIMLVPVALLLVQTEARFAFRPLAPGEALIVAANLEPAAANPELTLSPGLVSDTPALRVAAPGGGPLRVYWRVRGRAAGVQTIRVRAGASEAPAPVAVAPLSARHEPLAAAVYRADDWRALGSPAAAPLPAAGPVLSMTIDYPRAGGSWLGLSSSSWLLTGWTLLLGLAMRGVAGVVF